MKVLVTTTSFLKPENEKAKQALEAFADEVVYNTAGIPLEGDALLEMLDGVDAYIAGLDYITADVVERMPASLRVISRYGVGVDRVDIPACTKRGIKVTNTPGANAVAVAELAFSLMMSVARDIPGLSKKMEAGQWPRSVGTELCGKTLGIVGLGAIGKKLAVRARAFEMDVLAYDPFFDEDFAHRHGVRQAELDMLLQHSDFISLHVPLNEHTRHMVNKNCISTMKQGAIIVNTARGGLIDEAAAAEAVKSGKLRGLGLDAFEQEPLLNSPLVGVPGVVLTPHTGALTKEAVANMGNMAVENAIAVLTGAECKYLVN